MISIMIRYISTLSLLLSLSASAQPFKETVYLFDGRDLSHWDIVNDGQFVVKDGSLSVKKGTGWLRSKEMLSDCALHMEFRFLEENANSGIFVRTGATSHDDEKRYPDNGYLVQCIDSHEGEYPIASVIPFGAPPFELFFDLEDLRDVYRPAWEWQSYDIACVGESMKIWLNGAPSFSR